MVQTENAGALHATICDTARSAKATLQGLGLDLSRPVTIRLADRIEGTPDGCIAAFDSGRGDLRILTPDCLSELDAGFGSFLDLPVDALFDSLIVHELTHAAVDQSSADIEPTAHEYLAYALQLDSLPAVERQMLLGKTTVTGPVELDHLDPLLLWVHPVGFAVRAWRHFDAEPDKPAAVARILSGETRFPELQD